MGGLNPSSSSSSSSRRRGRRLDSLVGLDNPPEPLVGVGAYEVSDILVSEAVGVKQPKVRYIAMKRNLNWADSYSEYLAFLKISELLIVKLTHL